MDLTNPQTLSDEGISTDDTYLRDHQRKQEINNQRKIFQNQVFKFFGLSKAIGLVLLAIGICIFLILWGPIFV